MQNNSFGLRAHRSVRVWFVLWLASSLPLFLLIIGLRSAHGQEEMLAELQRNVQSAGYYAFNADITQHTVPVASVYNVGETSQPAPGPAHAGRDRSAQQRLQHDPVV